MKVYNRICVKEHKIEAKDGNSFTLEKGEEYLTDKEENGEVTVFSKYWVKVPVNCFTGKEEVK